MSEEMLARIISARASLRTPLEKAEWAEGG